MTNERIKNLEEKMTKSIQIAMKLCLAALVPPLGLPMIFKKNKVNATFAGVCLSFGLNMGYLINQNKEIYNNPHIETYATLRDRSGMALLSTLVSPLVPMYTHQETSLANHPNSPTYIVDGDDVITFDSKSQKYTLNFAPDRIFKGLGGRHLSVPEAQKRIGDLAGKLETLTSQGDIVGARKVSTELKTAQTEYDLTQKSYLETRAAYEGAVAKMNAELDSLRSLGKAKGGKN